MLGFLHSNGQVAGGINWSRLVSIAILLAVLFLRDAPLSIAEERSFMTDYSVCFLLEVPKRCMFGDFDAVREDMMWANDRGSSALVLSEVTRGEPGAKAGDALALVEQVGSTVEIPLEKQKTTRLFALSFCKDSSGKGSCRRSS